MKVECPLRQKKRKRECLFVKEKDGIVLQVKRERERSCLLSLFFKART
jgi:hypothetical protein